MKKLDLTYANRGLNIKTLAVHSGNFHADDVFAAMLLRLIYPGIKIVRSRDVKELERCDIVADVGLVYDDTKLRYDHHQEGKAGKRDNGIEYSGFGLIWKHWGLGVCKNNLELFEEIDNLLVQPIDASDNGQLLSNDQVFEGVREFSVAGAIASAFNYSDSTEDETYQNFLDAVDFAENIFTRLLEKRSKILEQKDEILKDYMNCKEKRFLVDEKHRPVLSFRDHMPELLFYAFPTDDKIKGWMIKTAKAEGFNNRKNLPREWAGKSGRDLEEISGIKGMTFCHNNLFICGAKDKEAILKALDAALKY